MAFLYHSARQISLKFRHGCLQTKVVPTDGTKLVQRTLLQMHVPDAYFTNPLPAPHQGHSLHRLHLSWRALKAASFCIRSVFGFCIRLQMLPASVPCRGAGPVTICLPPEMHDSGQPIWWAMHHVASTPALGASHHASWRHILLHAGC